MADAFYEDRHLWLIEQSNALEEGRLQDVDHLRLSQVIESMAQSDYDHLTDLLQAILIRLCRLQAIKSCEEYRRNKNHWRGHIAGYRTKALQFIKKNKSLKRDSHQWNEAIEQAYEQAFAQFFYGDKKAIHWDLLKKEHRFGLDEELLNLEFYPTRQDCE